MNSKNLNQAAEKRLLEYQSALAAGDFSRLSAVLAELAEAARHNPRLDEQLSELNRFLVQEEPEIASVGSSTQPAPLAKGKNRMPRPEYTSNQPVTALKTAKNRGRLALVAGLVVIVIASLGLLVWSAKQPANAPVSGQLAAPTASPTVTATPPLTNLPETPALTLVMNNKVTPMPTLTTSSAKATSRTSDVDLSYPGGRLLIWNEQAAFPNGRPTVYTDNQFTAYATGDDYPKVGAYYEGKLKEAGYIVTSGSEGCGSQSCSASVGVEGTKGDTMIEVTVRSPQVWQGGSEVSGAGYLEPYLKQMQPNQTFILVRIRPNPLVAQTNAPQITPTPPAQIAASGSSSTRLVLGPDNGFWADDGRGLVWHGPSKEIPTSQPGITFHLEWLVSNGQATHLLGRLTVAGKFNESMVQPAPGGQQIGSLTDENGHTYPLNQSYGYLYNGDKNESVYLHVDAGGPPLAPGTRRVTFKPGPDLPYSLQEPLTVDLQSFAEAKLPLVARLNQQVTVNGITLHLNGAYFGPDRTLLNLSSSINESLLTPNAQPPHISWPPSVDNRGLSGLTILTNKGQLLKAVPYSQLTGYLPNQNLLTFEPVPSGTQSLTLKLDSVSFMRNFRQTDQSAGSGLNGPGFKAPVSQLLQSGPLTTSIGLDADGFKIMILSMEAHKNPANGRTVLSWRYQIDDRGNSSGIKMTTAYFECSKCADYSGSGSGPQDKPNIFQENLEFHSTPPAEVNLVLVSANLEVTGPWEITVPVS